MSDDLLSRATAALRDETEDSEAGARFTRARVLASLNETRVKRRTRVTFLVPLAACFAAATAWGTSGDNASRVIEFVTQAFRNDPAPVARPKPAVLGAKRAVAAAPAVVPSVEAPVEAPVPEPPPVVIAKAPEPPRVARAAVPSAVTPERAADPTHDLYRVAHRAHFVDHDPAQALGAWEAYLRAAPSGRFSLEARYNRALCLVRLGRHDDARVALAPFAAGSYGEYRRAEAKSLLDGLASSR